MQIEERVVGDVMVLNVKGRMVITEGDVMLRDKINSVVHQGHSKVLLNLAEVTFLDSASLGTIIGAYTTLTNRGGVLKLANLTERIQDLLTITKLTTVFETYDTVDEGVKSFA